jgi:KDO2-lipid IV(A) lauroyltransferase
MIYWLHRLGAPLARWLPVQVSYAIASLGASIVYVLWREKRENAIENLAWVLGKDANSPEVHRFARRAFDNYAKYLIDMLRLTGLKPADLEQRVTVTGWEHFSEAMDNGTGLIFVGGHIGNSDLAAAILAGRGFPVHVIAEPLQPPRWDSLVQAARAAVGLRVIPLGSSALRALRVLRQKEILAFLIDRFEDEGVTIDFFGRRTQVPAGAAALALRSDACILGAYIVRSGNSYVAHISPAISPQLTGDPRRDLQGLTQAMFDWLERVIRQYPDQWFMFRPMWPPSSVA